nr:hypothetical protein [Prochloraceae cyanobacterium]
MSSGNINCSGNPKTTQAFIYQSSNWDYPIQVASVQTLTRKNEYPEAGLIVIDEAHHSITRSYTRI